MLGLPAFYQYIASVCKAAVVQEKKNQACVLNIKSGLCIKHGERNQRAMVALRFLRRGSVCGEFRSIVEDYDPSMGTLEDQVIRVFNSGASRRSATLIKSSPDE